MKKRLRKKLRVGEFTEFGCAVTFSYPDPDKWFEEHEEGWILCVEALDLSTCGGSQGARHDYLLFKNRGSVTKEDEAEIRRYMENIAEVTDVRFSALFDVNRADI